MVTGATDGIGKETARALADMGATTIVVGRNREKSIATVNEIRQETGNPNVEYMLADLSSQESAPARIVNVSSGAHENAEIDFDDLEGEETYSGWRAYGESKLANLLFTYELARRLEGTGVTVNSVLPGPTKSGPFHTVRRFAQRYA